MRRTVLALLATAVGLVLLLGYRTPDGPKGVAPRPAAHAPPPSTSTASQGLARVRDIAKDRDTASNDPGSDDREATTTSRARTTTTRAAAASTQRVTGPVVSTQYGPVQVRVTLRGDLLVDVTALQLPDERTRSAEFSNYAAPLLREEALDAQIAQIDTISGATYTSEGYIGSLQAALDSA